VHAAAARWIRSLGLTPHPEGGHYRETYRGPGNVSTAIYFLLEGRQVSRLHRIRADEVWHLYAGGPLTVSAIAPDGALTEFTLGGDLEAGQAPQGVVLAGHWFGAALASAETYALVGCTVAPGFEFAELELARRDPLLAAFPQHAALIERLTA
jgi:predicted cupin superfamily sugar epimerase